MGMLLSYLRKTKGWHPVRLHQIRRQALLSAIPFAQAI